MNGMYNNNNNSDERGRRAHSALQPLIPGRKSEILCTIRVFLQE